MIPFDTSWLPHILWENSIGFTVLMSAAASLLGGATGSLTVAFVAGYSMFAWISIHADIALLTDVFWATLILILLGFSFKVWRLEGAGGGN